MKKRFLKIGLIGVLPFTSIGANWNAGTSLVIPSNITFANGSVTAYEALSTVQNQGNATLNSGSNVILLAGQYVNLKPGFRVHAGGELWVLSDSNRNGISDYLESIDSDGDGYFDALEAFMGTSQAANSTVYELDVNNDGIADVVRDVGWGRTPSAYPPTGNSYQGTSYWFYQPEGTFNTQTVYGFGGLLSGIIPGLPALLDYDFGITYTYFDFYGWRQQINFQTENNRQYVIYTLNSAGQWIALSNVILGDGFWKQIWSVLVSDLWQLPTFFQIVELGQPLQSAIIKDPGGAVLGEIPVSSGVESPSVTITLPAGITVTVSLEDLLGSGDPVNFRVNAGPWTVGATVNLSNLGDFHIEVLYGDGQSFDFWVYRRDIAFTADPGKIHWGFDPPNPIELDPSNEYWASVVKGQENEIVNLEVGSTAAAQQLQLKIRNEADTAYVDPQVGSPYVDIYPKVFTAKTTSLTIEGKTFAGSDIKIIPIHLVQQGSGQVEAVLKVMVLPPRPLEVGIYAVEDNGSSATKFATNPAINVPSVSNVVVVLNDTFKQAGITFTAHASSSSTPKNLTYDTREVVYDSSGIPVLGTPPDDPETTVGQDARLSEIEKSSLWTTTAFQNACPVRFPDGPGVIFFKNSGYVYDLPRTFWKRGFPSGPIFLAEADGNAELAAAHEIGHQLGLSVGGGSGHDYPPFPPGVDGDNPGSIEPVYPGGQHLKDPASVIMADGAPVLEFPVQFKLPWLHGRWMKHEDWEHANEIAKDF